jgi:xanthine dehydrogenase accessory factor
MVLMPDLLERIAALRREGQSFAVATVVGRRAPVSAHLGDRAIVFADGRMEGFIGGACSREIIRRHALDALRARHGRLVSIRSDEIGSTEATPEHFFVPMTCVSEGAVDVFVEPFVRPRRLVVVGGTPVADALVRLAHGMEYDVVRVVDAREQRDAEAGAAALDVTVVALDALETTLRESSGDQAVVVASQGHYDEQALESVLKCNVRYVGLVASRKRGATIRALLEESGVHGTEAIRNPAGLDLGARTPPEVALSILAEIVQTHPSAAGEEISSVSTAAPVAAMSVTVMAVDPVCGMEVDVSSARHTAEVDGVVYYFCCPHCRARFLEDPQEHRARTS